MRGARVVATVVAREYLERVRTKMFIISTLAAPIILLLLVLVPAFMGARSAEGGSRVALLDRTGILAPQVAEGLESSGFQVETVEAGGPDEEALEGRLEARDLAAVIILDASTLTRGEATWRGHAPPSTLRRMGVQQAVSQVVLVRRLLEMEEGAEVAQLLGGGGLRIERLGEDAPDEAQRNAGMAAGFAGAFILYVVLLIYGSSVLRAVLEEKTGRIVEVVISSVRPWQLMMGKILGVGAVGLTQLGIFLLMGALLFLGGLPRAVSLLPAGLEIPVDLAQYLPGPGVLAFFFLCFFLGYFLYASLFAAVGAMCTSEEEAQQIQMPVVLLVVVPVVFLMPILEDPVSTLAVGLSLFPFFTPILMFARVAAGAAPFWQAALSVVLMLGTLILTAWVAGRIYRTGILMQGKRPTLPELWRWIRAG